MTRFLSQSLQASEPFFRRGLHQLEAANGHPNTDIRFTSEVMHATRDKLRELELDPRDTTPAELYHALQARVAVDDSRLERTLRTLAARYVSAEAHTVDGMIHALKNLPDAKRCYGLKASSLKAMLKKQPPKKALKQLGYRSLDSFLKHEAPASMLSAAWLSEGASWQKKFHEQYRKLKPSDFENRSISITHLSSKRWQKLAQKTVSDERHAVLCFRELGALVFLPFNDSMPAGSTTAALSLALHELNEIRAGSTFLKLSQVRVDFGAVVQTVAADEPRLSSELLDQPVAWSLIQRYYARLGHLFREAVFEPHIQLEDMAWHPIEQTLATIEPTLKFWEQTGHLGMLHNERPVSLNIVDAALNYCNNLSFEKRAAHYFQRSLWHELLLKYLQHESVERTVINELQPQMALEPALA